MSLSEHEIVSSQELVWIAKTTAIASNVHFCTRFPVAAKIDPANWDFFITIASVWVALTYLNSANYKISKAEIDEIWNVVNDSLVKEYPDGIRALKDCEAFMNQTLAADNKIRVDDALGCWIVWNLYGTKDLDEEQSQIIRILGDMVLTQFRGFGKSIRPVT